MRATKGTVLTSQSLSPWCDCRRVGSTLASWRWQDINVGNPLWRRALLTEQSIQWYIHRVYRLHTLRPRSLKRDLLFCKQKEANKWEVNTTVTRDGGLAHVSFFFFFSKDKHMSSEGDTAFYACTYRDQSASIVTPQHVTMIKPELPDIGKGPPPPFLPSVLPIGYCSLSRGVQKCQGFPCQLRDCSLGVVYKK